MSTSMSFPTLETKRLLLRDMNHDDADSIYQYLSDPDVIQYLEGNTDTLDEARGYVSWCIDTFYEKRQISVGVLNLKKIVS